MAINRGFKFSPGTVQSIYPYRRILMAASIICIVLAALVILNSISTLGADGQPPGLFFIIFIHILACALIVMGITGLKLGCLANSYGSVRGIVPLRPAGASIWMTASTSALPSMAPISASNEQFQSAYGQPPPLYSHLPYPDNQFNQPPHVAWSIPDSIAPTVSAASSTRADNRASSATSYPMQRWQATHLQPQEEPPPSYNEVINITTTQHQ